MINKKINSELFYTILVLSIAVFWGMGFVFIPWAQQAGAPSSLICLFRFGVSALLIAAIFRKKIKIKKENLTMGLVCGVLLFVGFLFNVMCQEYTSPSNAAFFTATNVVIVPILCAIFFRKYKTPLSVYISAGVSVAGVLIICMGGEGGFNLSFGIGDLMALASAILFSFHVLAMTKALEKMDSISLTFFMFAIASVMFLVYYLIFDLPQKPFSDIEWKPFFSSEGIFSLGFGLSITAITVLCSFYAYLVQTKAQSIMNPTKVTLILSSESAFGAAFSIIFGLEGFKWTTVAGGILILAAVFYTGWATRPKPQTPAQGDAAQPLPREAADIENAPNQMGMETDGTHHAIGAAPNNETSLEGKDSSRPTEEETRLETAVDLPAISTVLGTAQIPSIRQAMTEDGDSCETPPNQDDEAEVAPDDEN